jgi:hypothetical protein
LRLTPLHNVVAVRGLELQPTTSVVGLFFSVLNLHGEPCLSLPEAKQAALRKRFFEIVQEAAQAGADICLSDLNWTRITPFFNYPPDIRRAIYTTNSVESLNRSLRNDVCDDGHKIAQIDFGLPKSIFDVLALHRFQSLSTK